jgi:stearoyl-CoA desaturase (delta-9 desaturase)
MITLLFGYITYYILATIGISAGYHRYFTHRSFKASPFVEHVMLISGLICGGRSALTWAAVHRMHHAYSDTPKDPHSPKYVGTWNVIFNRWHISRIPRRFTLDLIKNPRVVFYHRYGKYLHAIYAIALTAIGINFFIIFAATPFILAWFGFGFLNWITHRNGKPVDVPLANVIAPGEGWHKVHHDHPNYSSLNKYDIAGWAIERFFIKTKSSS